MDWWIVERERLEPMKAGLDVEADRTIWLMEIGLRRFDGGMRNPNLTSMESMRLARVSKWSEREKGEDRITQQTAGPECVSAECRHLRRQAAWSSARRARGVCRPREPKRPST
jgi:hypothetical protein